MLSGKKNKKNIKFIKKKKIKERLHSAIPVNALDL